MNVLLWREWKLYFDYPLTFSGLSREGIGGTIIQMLWHARHLSRLGHRVQVLGAAAKDLVEEDVEFLGAADRREQEQLIASGRVRVPDVILLEGAFDAAPLLRSKFPRAKIVHVGQNIDAGADRQAFSVEKFVDVYAFVGSGHLADYCVRFGSLRHKFMLLRNVVPWEWVYRDIPPQPVQDHVIWVGSWWKKGLRQWAKTMERVLREFPSYRWTLCGPRYGSTGQEMPPDIFAGLDLPRERIAVKSLPLAQLASEISSARVVLVSLGNECGPGSVLDGHAMGRPVISGNDVVYKYSNPDGTGVRVTTQAECYQALAHLLNNPGLCDELGARGREFILREYVERNQLEDLQQLLRFLEIRDSLGPLAEFEAPSRSRYRLGELKDKIERKWNELRPRR